MRLYTSKTTNSNKSVDIEGREIIKKQEWGGTWERLEGGKGTNEIIRYNDGHSGAYLKNYYKTPCEFA